jgi:hypothetical protein
MVFPNLMKIEDLLCFIVFYCMRIVPITHFIFTKNSPRTLVKKDAWSSRDVKDLSLMQTVLYAYGTMELTGVSELLLPA